eukprot:jgi/Mesvir1/6686/Mv08912-RA.2
MFKMQAVVGSLAASSISSLPFLARGADAAHTNVCAARRPLVSRLARDSAKNLNVFLRGDTRHHRGIFVGSPLTLTQVRRQTGLVTASGSNNMFDMLRAAVGSKPGGGTGAGVLFKDTAPTWQQLEVLLAEQQAATGLPAQPDLVNGPPSAWSLKRLFGTTEEPKVHLYRDHAAWCPYCHRVWMQLEEKRIPYTITKINMRCYGDKPREFLRKVPSGLLPVVELNGRVYTESADIMLMLEAEFPKHTPLLPPASDPARGEVRRLMTLERMFFSAWLQWLLGRWANEEAKRDFIMVVDQIEEALREVGGGGPFLLGKDISLVDLMIAPFLERASASLLYWKGFRMRGEGRWPALEAWFEAMEARPAYQASKSDYYTHCHDLPPQVGEPSPIPGAEKFMDFINGRDGSWDLPLKPLTGGPLGTALTAGMAKMLHY